MRNIELVVVLSFLFCIPLHASSKVYNIRDFGAKGDGITIDTQAINAAISNASLEGGGTVLFPEGVYLSYSIHLENNITLHLEKGSVIKAAQGYGYDKPEPNAWDKYQDYGHSHWQNALIWGIGVENITLEGEGVIDGTDALTRWDPVPGMADKAVSMKNCNNVNFKNLTFINSGHFTFLLTGVDNLTIDNVTVDTNRDAFDIDCCRNVTVMDCNVNTLNDDAIVLKSSYALGYARATENVLVKGCNVSGYDTGTYLNGKKGVTVTSVPDRDGPCGRIKLGTESNGGFINIRIENCTFTHCRGLALESVDGGRIEKVRVRNLTMSDIDNSPIYIRLGDRMRGPEGLPASVVRDIKIANVKVENADCRYATLIIGMKDHPIEDVTLKNIDITYRGGLTMDDFNNQKGVNSFFDFDGAVYPEPSAHGIQPAWGLSMSYVHGIRLKRVRMELLAPDGREKTYIGPDVQNFKITGCN